MPTPHAAPLDVDRLLNDGRWTGYQQWLVLLTALTIIFDGFDNQLLGVSLPTIMREWGVTRGAFAPVVSLGYLGMVIGGTLGGLAGDRLGRRNALLGCMVLFGASTVAVAGIHGVSSLGLLRLVAGIGLGGAMPNAAALAAEYVPLRQRPFAVSLAVVCVPLGATLAGFAAIVALPTVGWRGLFILGGATPIVAAAVLAFIMPESPRFLLRHPSRWRELAALLTRMGHPVPRDATFAPPEGPMSGQRGSVTAIFGQELRVDTFGLWTAFFSCLFAVYLGFSWLPAILSGAGLGTSVASTGLTAFNLGGVVGALVGVFSTWTSSGPVSLNGTQGPNNGWLVVIFAFVALGGVRALSRGSWLGVTAVLGAAVVIFWTGVEGLLDNRDVLGGSTGWGLWLTILAALTLAAVAILVAVRRVHRK